MNKTTEEVTRQRMTKGGGASWRTLWLDGRRDWEGKNAEWEGVAKLLLGRRVGNKEVVERKEKRSGAQFSPADEKWTGKCLLGSPLPPLLLISSLSRSSPRRPHPPSRLPLSPLRPPFALISVGCPPSLPPTHTHPTTSTSYPSPSLTDVSAPGIEPDVLIFFILPSNNKREFWLRCRRSLQSMSSN